jgi:hypothetical protein
MALLGQLLPANNMPDMESKDCAVSHGVRKWMSWVRAGSEARDQAFGAQRRSGRLHKHTWTASQLS